MDNITHSEISEEHKKLLETFKTFKRMIYCRHCHEILKITCHYELDERGKPEFWSEPACCSCIKKHYFELKDHKLVEHSINMSYKIVDDDESDFSNY